MLNDLFLATAQSDTFGVWDVILFCVAVVGVIGLGIYKARPKAEDKNDGEKSAADYFLAGRGLTWWLVGFSLIAANISTEQFVGMSGQAADWLGMAIASYEWLAAITLVVVAFCFLPKLLRGGVYTIPEFLEYRYNVYARSLMAIATLLMLVGVPTATVIYGGAKVITVFFAGYSLFGMDLNNLYLGCAIIALCGAVYVYVGGLKACAWTDLIWGAALIVGGGVVSYLAIQALSGADAKMLWETRSASSGATTEAIQHAGAVERFMMLNSGDALEGANGVGGKLHMIRPGGDPSIPWTALMLGLWIPNFFYWGLNQYIMQRTLASKSLAEGQLGIVFAAFLKLIIPFVVVIPGILAYNLYSSDLRNDAISKNQNNGLEYIVDATAYKAALLNDAKNKKTPEVIDREMTVAQAKVYPMTTEFVAIDFDKAEKVMAHNIALIHKDSPKANELVSSATEIFGKIRQDASDETTNRTDRLKLAEEVVALNQAAVLELAKANKVETGTKLVGHDYDSAFPTLLKKLLKPGISWFVLASLFGAVVSSLASMLNSASTIFTMDIYHKFRKQAPGNELVFVGKIGVLVCVVIACCIAPLLDDPKFGGLFTFVQEFQGFVSPGALCVFLFGFFVPKCPRFFGWFGIALNVVLYAILMIGFSEVPFLNRMAICLGVVALFGLIFTIVNAARGAENIVLPVNNKVDVTTSAKAKLCGIGVVVCTLVLYAIFW